METLIFQDKQPNFEGEMKKDGEVQKLRHLKSLCMFNSKGDNLIFFILKLYFQGVIMINIGVLSFF